MHTPQSLFTTVARHLLTQMERSVRDAPDAPGNGCAYRGDDGRKCAVGCLIPDEQYRPKFEGINVSQPGTTAKALRAAAGIGEKDLRTITLADRLQALHDNQHPSAWRGCLARVAADYGLTMPEVPA